MRPLLHMAYHNLRHSFLPPRRSSDAGFVVPETDGCQQILPPEPFSQWTDFLHSLHPFTAVQLLLSHRLKSLTRAPSERDCVSSGLSRDCRPRSECQLDPEALWAARRVVERWLRSCRPAVGLMSARTFKTHSDPEILLALSHPGASSAGLTAFTGSHGLKSQTSWTFHAIHAVCLPSECQSEHLCQGANGKL